MRRNFEGKTIEVEVAEKNLPRSSSSGNAEEVLFLL
jgi:hypothetical protein